MNLFLCALILSSLGLGVNAFLPQLHGSGSRWRTRATTMNYGNFDQFLTTMEVPVLVDFYAEWCGPCKKMKTVLSEVATRLESVAKVAKVDTDKAPNLSAKYNIHALPTLILFNKGEVVERFEGYRSADEVESLVRQAVKRISG